MVKSNTESIPRENQNGGVVHENNGVEASTHNPAGNGSIEMSRTRSEVDAGNNPEDVIVNKKNLQNNKITTTQKTELNLVDNHLPLRNGSGRKIFKSEISITMEVPLPPSSPLPPAISEEQTDPVIVPSANISNLPSPPKGKQPLSRSTTQSRSSESDQIGLDYFDDSDRSSSSIDEDRSDFSSDYGTEKSSENSEKRTKSQSPSPPLIKSHSQGEIEEIIALREKSSPTPTTLILPRDNSVLVMKRFDSHSSAGHDNLGYIQEESEPDDKTGSGKSSATGSIKSFNNDESQHHRPVSGDLSSFDNLQRVILRDFRKEIVRSADRQEGICLETFIKLCKKQDLQRKLFDLFDKRQENELDQHEWIEFLKIRLIGPGPNREDRRVDFVELVESVTYAVCGDDNVDFDKFRTIFADKNVLTKFFRLIDKDSDGVVTAEQIMEFISQLSSARSSSRLTKENILFLEKVFRENVGDGNEIRKEDFKRIIQTKNEFFLDRVFDIFDEDGSGSISLHEFLDAMHQFAGQDADDKIRFLFKVYDVDGDGVIRCEELGKVMRACLAENGMKFSDTQTDELTRALFEDADVDGKGELTFDALKAQLKKHPGLLENMSIMLDQWLVPPELPKATSPIKYIKDMKPHQLSIKYIKNNYVYLIWRLIFIIVNIALFCSRCVKFHDQNPNATTYLVLARGAGQCLNFNCTFIVIVMLRQCLTFLRARGCSAFLPIDQHIKLHKMTGQLIFFFAVLHTVMHLVNISEGFMPLKGTLEDCLVNPNVTCPVNSGNWSYMAFLFDPEPSSQRGIFSLGLIPGYAFNSGVLIMLILTIMVIGSMPFVRRGGSFEVFYWTHLLYFPFWALLVIHAPNFWKWFLVPGIIFLIEQALRYYNWRMGRGRTSVSSGILLPSKVTHLVIRRPTNFDFRPGDYVFVRIPKIAKSEWHPFTISSAPEQEDAIWLHIRACGEWTSRLFEYFEKEQEKLKTQSDFTRTKKLTKFSTKRKSPEQAQNLELVKYSEQAADYRKRLPTLGVNDSQESVDPTSSTSMVDGVNNDTSSSVETVNECDSMIRDKKLPIHMKPKPKLVSTKSLPNVHERMKKREVKMQVRAAAPQFMRSMSVNEMENNENGSSQVTNSSHILGVRSRRTTAASFKYMRNKPTVIALKTPSYEEKTLEGPLATTVVGINCEQKLAEEGRSGTRGEAGAQQESTEGNDLHPILGTTNTKHTAVGRPLEIYLDGPYGAPSSHIFRAEHAVLIATGIGVTPFASILQSIMHRYWASRNCCPNCNFTWCGELPQSVLNLKKVDFFWINRDQRSFEWFVHLLSQLEIEQAEHGAMERFLDMHMYITSALQRTDMKAVGLQLALDLLHEKEKRDLITGLKTRTNAGRPNWNKVFQQVREQKKGKVTVFYCGPPALARSLKFKCDEFGFTFRKEIF